MNTRNPISTTAIACAAMALAAFATALVLGYPREGVGLAAGLLLGSLNGVLAARALRSGIAFQATSLGRLAALSAAGLIVGLLTGSGLVWPIVGLAVAQLALAGSAAYRLVRR